MLTGTVKEIGVDFYLMDLDELDADGNVVEFVFRISDATRMDGIRELHLGDRISLVCRGNENYSVRPWEFSSNEAQETEPLTAISVTNVP